MPEVRFQALDQPSPEGLLHKACELVAKAYEQRHKCVVFCATKADAEQMDELLWQLPAARFVPHNLAGEGPPSGTPVEIHWESSQLPRRQCLVNVSGTMLGNINQYQQIIDFVPVEEQAKQQARQRYKQFQQAGCQMQFLPA